MIHMKRTDTKHKIVYIGNDKWARQFTNIINNWNHKIEIVAVFTEETCKEFDEFNNVYKGNINRYSHLINEYKPDFMIEFGYPYLLGKELLETCPVIGMHTSLLPERRGHAPLNWAIVDGLKKTGVTVFYLDEGEDTGDIIYQSDFTIDDGDNINDLLTKANHELEIMANNIFSNWPNIQKTPQNHNKATRKGRRNPADGEIKQSHLPGDIDRLIRAVTPPHYPGAFINLDEKHKIIIEDAEVYSTINERGDENFINIDYEAMSHFHTNNKDLSGACIKLKHSIIKIYKATLL